MSLTSRTFPNHPRTYLARFALLAVCLSIGWYCAAPTPASPSPAPASASEPPEALVKDVIANELKAQADDHRLWSFQEERQEGGQEQTWFVVQTPIGDVHRLLAINGKPLDDQQSDQENHRLQKLASDPSAVRAQQRKNREDAQQADSFMRMLPTAFIYKPDGTQGNFARLSFTPNPNFHTSGHAEEVFHHLQGTMLVDPNQKRLVEIRGTLMSRVNFWGGLAGHLDQGGTFNVKDAEVVPGHWDQTLLDVHMDGKALFFHTISVREHQAYSDYHQVAQDITLTQAIDLLNRSPEQSQKRPPLRGRSASK
jgi:hypothetical protein